MAFNTTIFSTNGLNLLSQLSSTKSLRVKNIYVDEIEHAASDFNQLPSWWASQTSSTMTKVDAELSAASVISDQARLVVKLRLGQGETTTVIAKTIVITACGVESGVESTEITFCGISDSAGVEVLYNASNIKLSTSVAIYFAFNSTSDITFEDNIDPDFVIHSELDRFVSCHPIGDPTGGEAQTVGGVKTFKDGAVIDIVDSSKLSFQYNGDEQGWIGDTGTTGLQFVSNDVAVGEICFRFSDNNTAIVTISHDADDGNEYYLMDVDGNVTADSIIATTLKSTSVETNSCKIHDTTLASMYDGLCINGNFIPNVDRTFYLGLPSYRWATICGYEIRSTLGLAIDSQDARNNELWVGEDEGDIFLTGFLTGHGLYLGQMFDTGTGQLGERASFHCGDIYAKDIDASGNLNVSGTINGDLNGVIPVPSSETNIPVGCICVLKAIIETIRGDQFSKMPNEQGWMNRRNSSSAGLVFSDLEPESADRALTYSDYTQDTRFMALSHADANKPFLAIRTA